jgi:transposase InsO family protein
MDYANELKERVGLWLAQEAKRGSQKVVAQALKVTARTLRSWKKQALQKNKTARGRRRNKISFKEKVMIAREWQRQGHPGSRPVIKALPLLRVRVVREVISELKKRRSKRISAIKIKLRQKIKVKKAGSVLVMDGTSLSRGQDYIVYKDRGSLEIKAKSCDGNLSSKNTMEVLTELKKEESLPLVLCTDNGSPFCSNEIERFLDKNYILHLKNLPSVPQHNGACENAVREFKEQFIENFDLNKTLERLNENRKRQSLNWLTSTEFKRLNFKVYGLDERMNFYTSAKEKIKRATSGIKSAKIKRKVEREVILKTMESFSLITKTRGNESRLFKAEEIA